MWWAALFSGENGKLIRNIVIWSIIGTILVVIVLLVINARRKAKINKENQDKIINYEAEINPDNVSYTDSEFENFASIIDTAIGFWSDDEEAVLNVFMKMKTNSDLLKLQTVFGTRSGYDLFTTIRRNLNDNEIQKINTILAQRNISITV